MFKYTICFIKRGNQILLLNREKSSWMGSWNGVGGKFEKGESPTECILREVFEETGIKLKSLKYKGIVTWKTEENSIGGMYAFIAELPDDFKYETPIKMREGILDWKNIDWILNPENTGVASNMSKYLPKMLNEDCKYEHRCFFDDRGLIKVESTLLK